MLSWRDALKKFNDERTANGEGKYMIPRKGTPEHNKVMGYMNAPIKENLTADNRKKSRTPPKDKPTLAEIPLEQAEPKSRKKPKENKPEPIKEEPVQAVAQEPPKVKGRPKKQELQPPHQDGVIHFS